MTPPPASRLERALLLLRDLETTRRTRDTFQGGLVELALDELDAEGGYNRRQRNRTIPDRRIPGYGVKQSGALKNLPGRDPGRQSHQK
jgi:hypothetical protein